jgi:hypothetical protein
VSVALLPSLLLRKENSYADRSVGFSGKRRSQHALQLCT